MCRFKNLDFNGIRPDFAPTILAAARREFGEQWRTEPEESEAEGGAYPSKEATELGKQLMSSKSKSFTAFLSGDLNGRVTPSIAKHVEKDDLERYLELPQETDKDICVLTWWKTHAALYPDLALMARQYLSMPATSAACERLFNKAGRMHDAFKKNTKEDSLEDALLVSCNC